MKLHGRGAQCVQLFSRCNMITKTFRTGRIIDSCKERVIVPVATVMTRRRRDRPRLAAPARGCDSTIEPSPRKVAWMLVFTLVGEAPGRQEAEIADFVGPVGGALRDMMREAGIDASRVRLANAIPFRPIERSRSGQFRNRRPTAKELRAYGGPVLADITKVQPKIVGALGNAAAMLFGASMPL